MWLEKYLALKEQIKVKEINLTEKDKQELDWASNIGMACRILENILEREQI